MVCFSIPSKRWRGYMATVLLLSTTSSFEVHTSAIRVQSWSPHHRHRFHSGSRSSLAFTDLHPSAFQPRPSKRGPLTTLSASPVMSPPSASRSKSSSSSTTVVSVSPSPPIYIPDGLSFPLTAFAVPKYLVDSGELESVFIPSGMILNRIDKMAQDLLQATPKGSPGGERSLHLLCVLKGGCRFYHALLDSIRHRAQVMDLHLRISLDYIKVSSYSGTHSTGNVQVEGLDPTTLNGRDVVVVEDMIDTGNTMRKLVPMLNSYNPASLRIVALFDKRLPKPKEPIPNIDAIGFSIPNVFGVGFNMDYNEQYRDLDHLCLLTKKAIDMHKDR